MRSHPIRPIYMPPLLAGLILTIGFLAAPLALSASAAASAKPAEAAKPAFVREILVPMDDLNVLLENQPRRVLLSREEYEDLLKKARPRDEVAPPRAVVLADSRFTVEVRDGRAAIEGVLTIDVLTDGIHAVPLEMAHVGLRDAVLDDRPAPLGRDDGRLVLFVEGRGQHALRLSMTALVEATAATQVLTLRLPVAPSSRFDLTVEGDVEMKGGMEVVRRTLDDEAGVTRFELLPRGGDVSLVMTLNSRLRRKDQIVLARSVLLAMVGEAGQRLHSTISLSVLHRAADLFRFAVPDGFEITKVQSPELSSWSVVAGDEGRRVLEVRLREATTENVVLSIVAESNDPKLDDWTLPRIVPLDVDGQVAVVGVLVDPRLRPTMVSPEGLIPIDASVLQPALPATTDGVGRDEPPRTAVAAYYAAGKDFSVRARFERPAARFDATTVLLLGLSDKMQTLSGDLIVVPEHEPIFEIDFLLPAVWKVVSVVGAQGQAIPFERHENPARVHVRLPQGGAPGTEGFVRFVATATPAGWLGDWSEFDVAFPEVRLQGARRERGAIAVAAEDDLRVVPQTEKGLIPLDETQKKDFRLEGVRTDLAYRHDDGPFEAALKIERTAPRLTAKTHSFLRVEPGILVGHYEVTYDVTEARTRTLRFRLPNSTPADLAIVGLGGVQIKQYAGDSTGEGRLWTVELAEARRGPITLAVDFQQPLGEQDPLDLELPILVAEGVAHQSGLVAIEGNAELDVEVKTDARRVDVGELVDAEYQPGRRLLGIFSFVGQTPRVAIDAFRRPAYALSTAIVQQGRLTTTLSAEGVAQTDARFQLRSKAIYLEVVLPDGARLWSVVLDGRPIKPQSQEGRLLLNLAGQTDGESQSEGRATELQIVYEMPVAPVGLVQDVTVGAPRLLLREEADGEAAEVPLVGMEWELVLPWRYQVVGSQSTLMSNQVRPPEPVIFRVFQLLGWRPRGGLGCGRVEEKFVGLSAPTYFTDDVERPASEAQLRAMLTETSPIEDYHAEEVMTAPLPESGPYAKKKELAYGSGGFGLLGLRGVKFDLNQRQTEEQSPTIVFQSLGERPRLDVTLADRQSFTTLGWAVAMAVVLVGLALGRRSGRAKFRYLLAVGLIGSLLPVVPGFAFLAVPCDMAVYAVLALIAYYGIALVGQRLLALVGPCCVRRRATVSAALVLSLLAAAHPIAAAPPTDAGPMHVKLVDPLPEITVPSDAILIPYDPDAMDGVEAANRCFVPYDKYVDLWNRAHPERSKKPAAPRDFALAGASYTARLADGKDLLLEGTVEIVVYKASGAAVPLRLGGGVLADARLDGKPAQLSVTRPEPLPRRNMAQQAQSAGPAVDSAVLLLHIPGEGRHELALKIRLPLRRQGGWHAASGLLPAAAASSLVLTVPAAETDVLLGQTADRRTFETKSADERIETVLGPGGLLAVQWRPRLSRAEVQHSLTARSEAVFDIQEDALRLAWDVVLEFPRDEREAFALGVPVEWLVENVVGPNVRGWTATRSDNGQRIEIMLLKPARDTERFSVRLRRAGAPASFAVPNVTVEGAAIESGRVSIRRSPLLDVRTVATQSVGRTDFVLPDPKREDASSLDNPLGLRPYEAYQFASSPFAIVLTASPIDATVRADLQSVLRLSEESRTLESMVTLEVRDRPIFAVEILLPEGFELGGLDAPGSFQWSLDEPKEATGARRRLSMFFADGQQGGVPIVLRGKLSGQADKDGIRLPRLDVLGVEQHRGDLAVQVDPSFDVKAKDLEGCESVLLERLFGWLQPEQRELTRLALHFDSSDYDGRLILGRREPRVSCSTVSNVRVTQRALEETILLDFTIREAGIRRVEFVLPHWMRDARVNVPLLRRKIIAPGEPGEPVHVTLELQDEVIDQLRVLIENDRLLDGQLQTAPLPVVLTGATSRQFVTLESAGRDEVLVDEDRTTGLEPLSRAQSQWKTLATLLGEGITRAYLVVPAAKDPALAFKVFQRDAVVTAGARIGLAETDLVVDANGAYRGRTVYHMDNTTEQFLPIELPRGARLWSAQAAGEPVKPIKDINAADQRHVRIPLVKTSAGELDYQVVLVYGGRMSPIGGLAGKVDFPLPRTLDPKPDVSLTPELSQVRLHLPTTHRWFDFDGTMRRVEDESHLTAGRLAYQEKVVERLSETMRAGDEFAKARAAYNVQTMEDSFQQIQSQESPGWQGQEVQRQQAAAMRALGEARQQAEIVAKESLESVDVSNRAILNERVVQQQVKRSRGSVMQSGKNFAGAEEMGLLPAAGKKADVGFDAKWFSANSLVQQQGQEAATPMGAVPAARPAQRPPASAPAKPAVKSPPPIQLGLELKTESDKTPAFPAPTRPAAAEPQPSKMARYQQRLRGMEQAEREVADRSREDTPVLYPSAALSDPFAEAKPRDELGRQLGRSGQGRPTQAAVAVAPSGLASVAVDLPEADPAYYRTFLFTTPRGDVAVAGRAASAELIVGGRNVLVVLTGFVLLVLLVRTRAARWFATRPGGFALVVLGGLLTLSCLLPLGLLLFAVGVVVVIASPQKLVVNPG